MSWKTKYCEALALVPYAIDKDVNEVNLCEETLCKDCIFQGFTHCDAVNRANYYEEHFDEIFSKKVNRTRPAVGVTEDGYVGGCSDIDCYECIFRFSGECSIMAEEFVWEKIDEENRESTDIMTRFERDKEVLFDLLAEDTGVGIGDNKIYFCRELYCDDCLMNSACHKSINEAVRATHNWIAANFEKQHEDIMDYIYDTIAVDKWDNYTKCNLLSCRNCLFDKYGSCTELKKEYLNEEV